MVEPRISEQDMHGQFKIKYKWVEQLSDPTSEEFNELSGIVQNVIKVSLSDDAKYVKKIEVDFR